MNASGKAPSSIFWEDVAWLVIAKTHKEWNLQAAESRTGNPTLKGISGAPLLIVFLISPLSLACGCCCVVPNIYRGPAAGITDKFWILMMFFLMSAQIE